MATIDSIAESDRPATFWDSWSEGPFCEREIQSIVAKNPAAACQYFVDGGKITYADYLRAKQIAA